MSKTTWNSCFSRSSSCNAKPVRFNFWRILTILFVKFCSPTISLIDRVQIWYWRGWWHPAELHVGRANTNANNAYSISTSTRWPSNRSAWWCFQSFQINFNIHFIIRIWRIENLGNGRCVNIHFNSFSLFAPFFIPIYAHLWRSRWIGDARKTLGSGWARWHKWIYIYPLEILISKPSSRDIVDIAETYMLCMPSLVCCFLIPSYVLYPWEG